MRIVFALRRDLLVEADPVHAAELAITHEHILGEMDSAPERPGLRRQIDR